MIFASLKEQTPNENRVAVSAETIRQISQWGHRVIVEQGTGVKAGLSDDALQKAGAEIVSSAKEIYQRADILLKIWAPTAQDMKYLHEGQIILANFQALSHKDKIAEFAKKGVTCFALDLLPRLSRAQSMDILSSQSNLAGYKAVIDAVAAHHKAAPMMMTAAGTVPPIKVLILGAGVAGLQAVATAKRLGAVVYVSDVRPEVKEQVESLGGRFLEVKTDDNFSDSTGYAKETTAERIDYADQFNEILAQIDSLAKDASYKGINLLQENDLTVIFNEDRTSKIEVKGVDASSQGLGISEVKNNWQKDADIDASISQIENAISKLRTMASDFGNNYSIVQTREDFTDNLINVLTEGADNLTLADMNEESANMLALQTRQQLAINSLSLASQAAQSVLQLF